MSFDTALCALKHYPQVFTPYYIIAGKKEKKSKNNCYGTLLLIAENSIINLNIIEVCPLISTRQ